MPGDSRRQPTARSDCSTGPRMPACGRGRCRRPASRWRRPSLSGRAGSQSRTRRPWPSSSRSCLLMSSVEGASNALARRLMVAPGLDRAHSFMPCAVSPTFSHSPNPDSPCSLALGAASGGPRVGRPMHARARPDRRGIHDGCDESHPPRAPRTLRQVHREHPLRKIRPGNPRQALPLHCWRSAARGRASALAPRRRSHR